jgi:hypothetical protein
MNFRFKKKAKPEEKLIRRNLRLENESVKFHLSEMQLNQDMVNECLYLELRKPKNPVYII